MSFDRKYFFRHEKREQGCAGKAQNKKEKDSKFVFRLTRQLLQKQMESEVLSIH